jgi:hypothetical protein
VVDKQEDFFTSGRALFGFPIKAATVASEIRTQGGETSNPRRYCERRLLTPKRSAISAMVIASNPRSSAAFS